MKDNKYTFTSDKWIIIWILVCLGEPDILDGIIKLIHNLGEYFAK